MRNLKGNTPLEVARDRLMFTFLDEKKLELALVIKYLKSIDQSDSDAMIKRGVLKKSKSESCKLDRAVL